MSKVIKSIADEDMQELIRDYVAFKKAEAKFKKTKEKVTKYLVEGVYESEYGKVNKFTSIRKLLNSEKLADEHPEVIELMEQYKEDKPQTSVLITNYME